MDVREGVKATVALKMMNSVLKMMNRIAPRRDVGEGVEIHCLRGGLVDRLEEAEERRLLLAGVLEAWQTHRV